MQREIIYATIFVVGIFFCFWYVIAYSFYDQQLDTMKKFSSDGCTFFSDDNIKDCCVAHDRGYWVGGSANDRKKSDTDFQKCVYNKTQNKTLSHILYFSVRAGGVPYIKTPWRWGFGWEFGRGYR
jgi:hypothetical protein